VHGDGWLDEALAYSGIKLDSVFIQKVSGYYPKIKVKVAMFSIPLTVIGLLKTVVIMKKPKFGC
jgi:hypothetical protein